MITNEPVHSLSDLLDLIGVHPYIFHFPCYVECYRSENLHTDVGRKRAKENSLVTFEMLNC
jgi:hypothetical protein